MGPVEGGIRNETNHSITWFKNGLRDSSCQHHWSCACGAWGSNHWYNCRNNDWRLGDCWRWPNVDLCDLARSNMALYLDVMSTDSGLQFAWGEISRYMSKRYRRYQDICPTADLNHSQEDQEMTISAYPWPFKQLFSGTLHNYAMINTIISFPVQKNSLFMKIFGCTGAWELN